MKSYGSCRTGNIDLDKILFVVYEEVFFPIGVAVAGVVGADYLVLESVGVA